MGRVRKDFQTYSIIQAYRAASVTQQAKIRAANPQIDWKAVDRTHA